MVASIQSFPIRRDGDRTPDTGSGTLPFVYQDLQPEVKPAAVSTAMRATTENEKHAIPAEPHGQSAKADFAVSGATSVAGRI